MLTLLTTRYCCCAWNLTTELTERYAEPPRCTLPIRHCINVTGRTGSRSAPVHYPPSYSHQRELNKQSERSKSFIGERLEERGLVQKGEQQITMRCSPRPPASNQPGRRRLY